MGPTVNRVPTTISKATKRRPVPSGFTLIEVLLVLAIIAMVMAVGLPAISRVTIFRLNSTARQFSGLVKTIRNDAILLNQAHRLAFNLEKKTYWVEAQTRGGLLNEVQPQAQKGKEAPPSVFTMADKYSKEPRSMPGGVEVSGVYKEKEGQRTDGVVYLHFFPNGINDAGIIYLQKEASPETTISLLVRPTSGRVDMYREKLKDLNASPQQ